jgi:hypothetical protein
MKKNPYYSKHPRKGKWFLNKEEANNCIMINSAFNVSETHTNHLHIFLEFVAKTYPDIPSEMLHNIRYKYNEFQVVLDDLYSILQNKMVAASDTNTLLHQHKITVKEEK